MPPSAGTAATGRRWRSFMRCRADARLAPRTGRTHQVRVHLKTIEHPILGDEDYGTKWSRDLSGKYHIEHLCLHAWKLKFRSPEDDATHALVSPPPQVLMDALRRLNIVWKS